MVNEMCESSDIHPLTVDGIFNFGKYEVTPFTYRHPNIESKSKNVKGLWTNAVIIGPTLIQQNKQESTYTAGFKSISATSKLEHKKVNIVTDGEEALINSSKEAF